MLETPHVIIGAAIATKIAKPVLAIPLAFFSHFALEKVPHWNPHLNTETEKYGRPTKKSTKIVIVDATTALVLGTAIASRALPNTAHFITIIAACFFSVLPDVVEAPYFFLNIKSKAIKNWIRFQKSIQSDAAIIPGLTTQLITILAGLLWIFN